MKYLIVVTLLLLVAGCSPARQAVINISDENIKNAETIKEVAEKCRSVWLTQSGFIDGAFGNRINELPKEAIEAKDKLDQLAEQTELTDYELGLFLGLKVRLLGSVAQVAIEKYAPGMVDLLPLVF